MSGVKAWFAEPHCQGKTAVDLHELYMALDQAYFTALNAMDELKETRRVLSNLMAQQEQEQKQEQERNKEIERFDAVKKLICDTVAGLKMKQLDDDNWEVGGVYITRDTEYPVYGHTMLLGTTTAYIVNYPVDRFSNNPMEPDDVDVVEVGTLFSLEAAIPCAIQACIDGALACAAQDGW